MFEGCHVATVTPFHEDGSIDFDRLGQFVDFYAKSGLAGVVPCGTTGESPTLTHDEHEEVVRFTIERSDGRLQVIAGSGSNSTQEALRLTRSAEEAGADGALIITPYYNKPTQTGLYEHFRHVHDSTTIPIVVYNVPCRTGISLTIETYQRLAKLPRIVAVKEASGDLNLASELAARTDLEILSGDDSLTLPILAVGGVGVISVISNLFPETMRELITSFTAGRHAEALGLHQRLFPICQAMFLESNPIPVKTALRFLGRDSGRLRLPLTDMRSDHVAALRAVLGQTKTRCISRSEILPSS